jgi:CDP-glucose 4,6-dehydratase
MTAEWGEGATWEADDREHPHEAHYLKLDCSKAKSYLDWHPRWHLEQTIERIVAWQRAYIAEADMREVSLAQIRDYDGSVRISGIS